MFARLLRDLAVRWRRPKAALRTASPHVAPTASDGPSLAQAAVHAAVGGERQKAGDNAGAIESYRRALATDPSLWPVWCNLAVALKASGDHEESAQALRRALEIAPECGEAHLNLGLLLLERGDLAGAERHSKRAAELLPDRPEAHFNLGNLLWQPGRLHEAVAHYERAIRLRPDHADAHWNLAHLLLHQGDWARGFEEYEWRWKLPRLQRYARSYAQPWWRGESLEGKTVLVWWEQGFGDTLQFMRYAQSLAKCGARVILDVQRELKSVAATVPGVATVLGDGPPPPFDYHLPVMSLARALRIRPDDVGMADPYISAPPAVRERWREKLGDSEKLRVGLVWSSGIRKDESLFAFGVSKSMPLAFLAPLSAIEGVELHSVQTGEAAVEADLQPYGLRLRDWHAELHDFGETAGLVSELDLLVTVDTAAAHLAGAMGKPVWMLMKPEQCWRWLREREDTPWYPSMKLFRQETLGDWSRPVEAVARELSALAVARTAKRA